MMSSPATPSPPAPSDAGERPTATERRGGALWGVLLGWAAVIVLVAVVTSYLLSLIHI